VKYLKNTPNSKIFLILGHGCDTGIQFSVPKGSIYCTRVECGRDTRTDKSDLYLQENFIKHNNFSTYEEINEALSKNGISPLKPHTYHKNKNKKNNMYSNTEYRLLSFFPLNKCFNRISIYINDSKNKEMIIYLLKIYNYISYSGIIEYTPKDTSDFHYRSVYSLLFDDEDDFNEFYSNMNINTLYQRYLSKMNNTFFIDLINYTYKYSFFPSILDVTTVYENNKPIRDIENFEKIINNHFTISQAELFRHFPGTYYNILCRSNCPDADIIKLEKRRSNSIGLEFNPDINISKYNSPNTVLKKYRRNIINRTAKKILKSNRSTKLNELKELNYNIITAVKHNKPKIVKLLLENGADPNVEDEGRTLLSIAALNNEMLRLLLEKGADPNIKDDNGATPIIYAVYSRKIDNVKLLLDHHADPNVEDEDGETPLIIAKLNNDIKMVELLSHVNPI